MAARRRLRQGVRALVAFARPVETDLAARHLTPALMALFQTMHRSEQLHSLNVLRDVLASGPTPPDLAVAALLHDCGKTRFPIGLWQRTLAVLVPPIAPGLARRWAAGTPSRPWQRPFVVRARHAEWGAELVAAAGAAETAVWLVREHQANPARWRGDARFHLIERLQAADDAN